MKLSIWIILWTTDLFMYLCDFCIETNINIQRVHTVCAYGKCVCYGVKLLFYS